VIPAARSSIQRRNPLTIDRLWALPVGNGAKNDGSSKNLFFTAGIADESHGLFGFSAAGREGADGSP